MLAELLDTQEEQSPLEMAQKVALMYRDKEEVIEDIDLLVADTLTMTADERCDDTCARKRASELGCTPACRPASPSATFPSSLLPAPSPLIPLHFSLSPPPTCFCMCVCE